MSEAFRSIPPFEIRPQHDEQADFSMATLRLLGIGLRPYDQKTLNGVKSRFVAEYGEVAGPRIFEEFQFRAIMGINITSIRENYPEVQGEWLDRLEKQSIKV